MTKRTRRTHSAAFKTKVALTTVKGEWTLAELAHQFDVTLSRFLVQQRLRRSTCPRSRQA
ncbi:hypothetical protein [Burkholderia sp. NFPP32]|uniref:hypothetical protein n=1 Tax=Burkholderia sp. NFPP32 TaxID=1566267 RepID=UPI000930BD66|nr:hypothetical protein [Burkholderia sp. NFPP32]